jgi:hypothetical protein
LEESLRYTIKKLTRSQALRWFTPVILAIQETEIRRIAVRSHPGQIVRDPISEKPFTKKKKGLVEWLKVLTLCSNSSTKKKKKPQGLKGFVDTLILHDFHMPRNIILLTFPSQPSKDVKIIFSSGLNKNRRPEQTLVSG